MRKILDTLGIYRDADIDMEVFTAMLSWAYEAVSGFKFLIILIYFVLFLYFFATRPRVHGFYAPFAAKKSEYLEWLGLALTYLGFFFTMFEILLRFLDYEIIILLFAKIFLLIFMLLVMIMILINRCINKSRFGNEK